MSFNDTPQAVGAKLIDFLADAIEAKSRDDLTFNRESVDVVKQGGEDGKTADYTATMYPTNGYGYLSPDAITSGKRVRFRIVVDGVDEIPAEDKEA